MEMTSRISVLLISTERHTKKGTQNLDKDAENMYDPEKCFRFCLFPAATGRGCRVRCPLAGGPRCGEADMEMSAALGSIQPL